MAERALVMNKGRSNVEQEPEISGSVALQCSCVSEYLCEQTCVKSTHTTCHMTVANRGSS